MNAHKQEPLFQINSNNSDLINFEKNTSQNQINADLFNSSNINNTNSQNNVKNKFNFINKNNPNINSGNNAVNNNVNIATFNSTPHNLNPNNDLFSIGSNNANLLDIKSKEQIVDEKFKKITDNIEELYKNSNNFQHPNESSNGLNINGKPNRQNDLFNALNPQMSQNSNFVNINNPNINIQNSFYNFNQNQQMMPPNQYNMNHNNNFYFNGMNMGFNSIHGIGNSGCNNGYGANYAANTNNPYLYNNPNNKNTYQQQINYRNNNFNNGLLTANDIYLKKDEPSFNLNSNGSNGNNFQANSNLLNFNEVKKPKQNEDPFSNLISFK